VNRDVRNCKRCGKIMIYVGIPICEECLRKEEEYYEAVRRYLDDQPGSNIKEISEATRVPVEIVMEFVRQGSLVASRIASELLSCKICGEPIQWGRVCPKCAAALTSTTEKVKHKASDDTRPARMYSMDMISRRKG
jgi:ribosomal protein L32